MYKIKEKNVTHVDLAYIIFQSKYHEDFYRLSIYFSDNLISTPPQ